MFEDYAARGRAFIDAVGRLAAARGRNPEEPHEHDAAHRRARGRPGPAPARDRTHANTLQRERHEPEYGILVATIALAAIGILMVYSSSAIKSLLQRDDPFAIVGPQIFWAALGLVAMVVMMRVDYRWLRVASVPLFAIGVAALILVFVPQLGRVVGGSARWLVVGPLAAHPAEFMKLALVVYLAHWFAKRGSAVHGILGGTLPFLVIAAPVVVLVLAEPDLGTASVLAFTAFTMFFLAGANLLHLAGMAAAAVPAVALMFLKGYQMDRITAWLDPFHRPATWASTASRASSPSPSAGSPARASARAGSPAGCSCPTPSTTSSSRSSARSSACWAPAS